MLSKLARALGVAVSALMSDVRALTEDERAELEELRRHPDLRVEFLNLARSFDEMSDQDKRGLLEALRFFSRARGLPTAE